MLIMHMGVVNGYINAFLPTSKELFLIKTGWAILQSRCWEEHCTTIVFISRCRASKLTSVEQEVKAFKKDISSTRKKFSGEKEELQHKVESKNVQVHVG